MFYFKKTLIEEDFIQFIVPPGAYEIEILNNEIRRLIIDKGHYTAADFPFTIKSNFSTLGSIIEILTRGPIIGFEFMRLYYTKNIMSHKIQSIFSVSITFFSNVILLTA